MAKGLDVGTSNIICATSEDNKTIFKRIRDAFFVIEPVTKIHKMTVKRALDSSSTPYLDENPDSVKGRIFVLGQGAIDHANVAGANAQRPMAKGVISPTEPLAKLVLSKLIAAVLGQGEGKVVYSVPGTPVDAQFDEAFHQQVLYDIIKELGYSPTNLNEAEAIAYSELLDEGITGTSISMGAGMINVCVIHSGNPICRFSSAKSGDWIDEMVARATNLTPTLVQAEKESGVDLLHPKDKIQEAIVVYYRRLLDYTLKNIINGLNQSGKIPNFKDPIKIVVAGGTSMATNFVPFFYEMVKESSFPIRIKDLVLASDPMNCIANGCLLSAQL